RPGTALREASMADALGISRNTMREVIRELVHEGLVRHRIHRGAVVTKLGPADVRSIFRARRGLELTGLTAARGQEAEVAAKLDAIVGRLERAARSRRYDEVLELDAAFHGVLVDLLESDRLATLHQKLLRELRLGFLLVDRRGLESLGQVDE